MLDSIVDHRWEILIGLCAVAMLLGAVWWNTRKTWALIATGVTVGVMGVVIVLSLVWVTDSMRLEENVAHIRDAVNKGKYDEALNYFDDAVKIKTMSGTFDLSKDQILAMANRTKDNYQVKQIETGTVHVDELNKPHAKIRFQVGDADDGAKRGWCTMDCAWKSGKWVVTSMTVEALIGGQTLPVLLPVGGSMGGMR